MKTSWATFYIRELIAGNAVSFRPQGSSMTPKIKSGQLCHLIPLGTNEFPIKDDIVLCHVKGKDYLHLVLATRNNNNCFECLIGNNHGGVNGWTKKDKIYGKLIKVEQ